MRFYKMNHSIKTLAADVRKVMLDRIQSASNADLFAIASSLFADDERPTVAAQLATPRFTLYDLRGNIVLSGGVAVYDALGFWVQQVITIDETSR